MTRSILFLSLLTLVAACKKDPPEELSATKSGNTEVVADATRPLPGDRAEAIEQMGENFARVHFALDASELDATAMAALSENARLMSAFPRIAVEIQGHADERGTTEYNLALGERRAHAVQRALTSMGVEQNRLAIVTYGEERPAEAGSGESAWSKNRRAEFRILVRDAPVQGTVD